MIFRLYQIIPELDSERIMFCNLKSVLNAYNDTVPAEIYKCVFSEPAEEEKLEEMFAKFNSNYPEGYKGRSMSVSDVVEYENDGSSNFYYCDSIGFKNIEFDKDRSAGKTQEKSQGRNGSV